MAAAAVTTSRQIGPAGSVWTRAWLAVVTVTPSRPPTKCWCRWAVALLRRGTGATWRDAFGALFVWQSTSIAVARASTLGLFARKAAFLRTPKTSESTPWWQSFRANWLETLLAVLGLLGIIAGLTRLDTYAGPMLAALLVFPTLGMAAAPFNCLAARRAALPGYLRERRRSEWARERGLLIGGAAVGGTTFVLAGIAVVVLLLLTPTARLIPPPHLRGPTPHVVSPTTTPPAPGPATPTPSAPPSVAAPGGSGSDSPTTGGPSTGTSASPASGDTPTAPGTNQPSS